MAFGVDHTHRRHSGESRSTALRALGGMPACAGMTAIAIMASLASPALAFDCTKAKTAVEKAICADPALKQVDDDLATAYSAVRSGLEEADQKMMTISQKRWIARREACGSDGEDLAACVKQRTAERLAFLKGTAASGPEVPGKLVPVFVAQTGKPGLHDIDLTLLRFEAPVTPGQQTLNRLTDEIIAAAKLGPQPSAESSAILAEEDSFSVTYASPTLMSVRHDFYDFEGGAHGNYGTTNININMESGELLKIADVLPEPSAAILTLWCKQQIEAEKQKRLPGVELSDGAAERDRAIAEVVRDLASWSIGETEIVVSFDPYAVGAYAEGAYQCRFPTAGVKQMALEGAPLP